MSDQQSANRSDLLRHTNKDLILFLLGTDMSDIYCRLCEARWEKWALNLSPLTPYLLGARDKAVQSPICFGLLVSERSA